VNKNLETFTAGKNSTIISHTANSQIIAKSGK
jgi:hypothetical protein